MGKIFVAVCAIVVFWLIGIPALILIPVAWIVWFLLTEKKANDKELQVTLSRINEAHETNFKIENSSGYDGKGLFYDETARKFFFIDSRKVNSSFQKVVDFSYIKSWNLTWVENSRNGTLSYDSVVMKITTNDISNPLINIPMRNKPSGERFHAILNILLA
jgi:hypothetical protein